MRFARLVPSSPRNPQNRINFPRDFQPFALFLFMLFSFSFLRLFLFCVAGLGCFSAYFLLLLWFVCRFFFFFACCFELHLKLNFHMQIFYKFLYKSLLSFYTLNFHLIKVFHLRFVYLFLAFFPRCCCCCVCFLRAAASFAHHLFCASMNYSLVILYCVVVVAIAAAVGCC